LLFALVTVLVGSTVLAADDPAAERLLNEARQALEQKNYPAATQRYRDFVSKYATHKQAPAARFGLARCLLATPDPNFKGVVEQLQMIAGAKDLPEHPFVLYHLAVAQRGLGAKEKARAAGAPPQEAPKLDAVARERFTDAAKLFAAAAEAFLDRAKQAPGNDLTPEREWAILCRCDQAEMLLETDHAKEAQAVSAALLKDSLTGKSRHSRLALYYDGWSRFLLKDNLGAGRALNLIANFGDAGFGTHARYLLARIHHLEDERAEATAQYEGVINDYEAHRKNAQNALRRPDLLRNDPTLRPRLEALVRGPAPEHVARSNYYLGVLQSEAGRFADAQARFANYIKMNPKSPLVPECQLRQAICFVQTKQMPQAIQTLQPLLTREPQLADQILFWIGRAVAGSAPADNAGAVQEASRRAIAAFQQAAAKAKDREGADPDAKKRRGEILLHLGDTQQVAGQYKEAAQTYAQLLNEKLLPNHDEEVLQHQIEALNLAGDYDAADTACERFQKSHAGSPLLPAVLFRHAENAAFRLLQAEKNPNLPDRANTLAKLGEETAKRYQALIQRFPEFEYANLARFGIGAALYQKGALAKANAVLMAISTADRRDELNLASYMQADCLIRLAPVKADDALAVGKLQEELQAALEQLNAFVGAQPRGPLAADALLKIGYCNQRLGNIQPQPAERAKYLTAARVAYKRLYGEYPRDEVLPFAVFQEAKCFIGLGTLPRAVTNLQRFTNEFKQSPIAPLAILQLATVLRGQNRAADAATLLAQCREQYGEALKKDAARAAWLPLLQLHQGICLREAGKLPEARALFESLVKDFPQAPQAAEAALRRGQCLKEEALPPVEKLRQRLLAGNLRPEELADVVKSLGDGLKGLADAANYLVAQADQIKQKQPDSEVRARMLYEAAWAMRYVAEAEIAVARAKLRQEQKKDVPLADVPLQPAEKKMRELYQSLIAAFAELPLTADARLELGEVLAERGDPAGAIKNFNEALDQEPPPDVADKLRLRMAAALAAKGDPKTAQTLLEAIAGNNKSPMAGTARDQLRALREKKPLPPLPLFGQAKVDRASLDDPTAGVAMPTPIQSVSVQRTRPAPFLRLTLPDPYEHHYAIKTGVTFPEDVVPVPGMWPYGG
jgi:TolA-binding protein